LKIAVRKRKAFMLKALEETETPRHAIAEKGSGGYVESGYGADDTSVKVGKTS